MNTPLVQKGSIAAAQIDKPELADVLQLDERVYSRDFRQVYNKGIGCGSSHRTSPVKNVAFAVSFQPGALFFRRIHLTVSTKKNRWQSKRGRLAKPSLYVDHLQA
jgi:hypothetical protein